MLQRASSAETHSREERMGFIVQEDHRTHHLVGKKWTQKEL